MKATQVASKVRAAVTPVRVTVAGAVVVGLFLILRRVGTKRADGRHVIQD